MQANIILILLFLALTAHAQLERIAIINTMDDSDSMSISELAYLTDRLRETAVNLLPKQRYGIMTTESMVAFLGSHERLVKECKASSCLAELGRKVNADYVAQGRVRKFGGLFSINFDLYNSKSGIMIGSFTGSSENVLGLRAIIDEKAPVLFKKLEGYKRHIVSISTDPLGALLSFDGESLASCLKTPCKVELDEGDVRIIAALEQYKTADTTVFIVRDNQALAIRLKPTFVMPAAVEAEPKKPSHTMLALALDIAGAVLISAGIVANTNMQNALDKYAEIKKSPEHYVDAWAKVESNRSARDVRYVVGGIFLASGIGVHIWF